MVTRVVKIFKSRSLRSIPFINNIINVYKGKKKNIISTFFSTTTITASVQVVTIAFANFCICSQGSKYQRSGSYLVRSLFSYRITECRTIYQRYEPISVFYIISTNLPKRYIGRYIIISAVI